MEKRGLSELVGYELVHKKLGPCTVLEVTNNDEGKFIGKVQSTGETKKLIFSNQFFEGVDEFATVNVKVAKPIKQSPVHKKVDLDKYRNHPLVKQIDQQESKSRIRQLYDDVQESLQDDDEDEENEVVTES